MTCEECERTREIDGAAPDCEIGKDCIIPPLGEEGTRVLAIRERLMRLKDLVDPATILASFRATEDDIDMLERIEKVIQELNQKGKNG